MTFSHFFGGMAMCGVHVAIYTIEGSNDVIARLETTGRKPIAAPLRLSQEELKAIPGNKTKSLAHLINACNRGSL